MKNIDKNKVFLLNDGTKLVEQEDSRLKSLRLFLSPVNEEKWLNYMASQGYAFVERKLNGYYFMRTKISNSLYYSVKYSAVSSTKDELCDLTSKEAQDREHDCSEIVTTYCTKTYYKTDINAQQELGVSSAPLEDAANKRRHLKYRFAFSFGMLCLFLGLLCYNLMYWVRFNAGWVFASYTGGVLHDYKDKENSLWEYTKDISDKIGKFPCAPHISFFAVLTVLALPFAIYYFDQYMYSRSFEKQLQKRWKRK